MIPTALYRYRNPLATSLTFAGQTLTQRDGLLLKFTHNGHIGWGDCAPLPGFSHDSLDANQQALQRWCQQGGAIESLPAAAQFAISSGRYMARQQSQRPSAGCAAPVPLLHGSTAHILAQAQNSQPRTVKLKLARNPLTEEIALVQQLQRRQPRLRLRIDANQGWNVEQACAFANAVDLSRIDYVEEPCLALTDSLQVHQRSAMPLALDETTQQPNYRYQTHPGVVALVLKPTILGHINKLRAIISAAAADGVASVLSSSFESNLGLLALASLAGEFTPQHDAGLDTLTPLYYDLCQPNPWIASRPLLRESQLEPLWP
ncbi:o-succinylbenzoate synthase [uncultured Ferrimonas sp.]|uniref:o-succinylbenzoate synthase n=1 Tax=uncultured Ferrimonas sp. TaxID=432640 RepID=UPI00260F9952|nr:o-succinylbenzoate synthase [uncultured Ferrimonas sp.]